MPKIRGIGERIESYLDVPNPTPVDRISASHVKQLIVVRFFFLKMFIIVLTCPEVRLNEFSILVF